MKKINQILNNNQAVTALINGNSHIITNSSYDEAYLLATAFLKEPKNYVVVKNNLLEAQYLYQTLASLIKDDCLFFPVDESLRVEALASSPEMLAERINAYYQLSLDTKKIVITCTAGIIRYSPSPTSFKEHCVSLKENQVVKIEVLKEQFIELGYQYISKVDQAFYFSHRGGIIDIYSINYEYPIRIEFFDDEIESLRFYDPSTQRSVESVQDVLILPANELFYDVDKVEEGISKLETIRKKAVHQLEDNLQSSLQDELAFDYESLRYKENLNRLYKYYSYIANPTSILEYVKDPCLVLSKYEAIKDNYLLYMKENDSYSLEMFEDGRSLYPLDTYMDLSSLLQMFHNKVYFDTFKTNKNQIEFKTRNIDGYFGKDSEIIKRIKEYILHNKVLLVLNKEHVLKNLSHLLEEHQVKYQFVSKDDALFDSVNLYIGDLPAGIEFLEERIVVLTMRELIGESSSNKTKFIKYKNAKIIKNFDDLHVGDYIVHDTHGIGQYLGIKTLEVKGSLRDYLYISYRGNDTLYLPVDQFKMIRKYTSKEGKVPKINKLGSSEWTKTKQRIRKKVEDIADALIALYAERMAQPGFAFKEDGALQYQFENDFEYELTQDQKIALEEIKEDMQVPQPMDRLLCGDVGFGKTEVALRAAFKAIESNKQVAFLCPTTILANQHYKTMLERFARFPVSIALLSRFVSPKQQKEVLEKVEKGQIDILVGTHRILSNDVKFKDVGLLIVDEEQRFGVKHKEKIKEYKKTIDVLTLTATPIPRTLQMSLMGIRGLSTIDTPPKNRYPVQTYVVEKDIKLVKQVIERELARDGQIFYLYNRTEDITRVANQISKAIPYASVGVGHGQMSKNDLEDVMNSFIKHEFNVLVCTTIIETGIDIPNVNTIIVENADRFGLSQLYQIKGRVGRSDRHAYAYLMYQPNKQLNEEAVKRLKAIKEFTELGSGYKIAMRDLSIRGAGDILGGEQAGFIDSVGFDMYMQILQEAINEKKGIVEVTEEVPITNVSSDGYIPKDYVNSDLEKLYLYQQLNKVNQIHEIDEIRKELKDIYGTLPKVVSSLIDKREFDVLNSINPIEDVLEKKSQVEITFDKEFSDSVDGVKFWDMIYKVSKKIKISYLNSKISIIIPKEENWLFNANAILRQLK